MHNSKLLFCLVAFVILLALPLIIFRQDSTSTPLVAPAAGLSANGPASKTARMRDKSAPGETMHYRPTPASDEVRAQSDAIIGRHAGMTKQEVMQSPEIVSLMERVIAVINTPAVLQRIEKSVAELRAVTAVQNDGSMTLEWFDSLGGPNGRAWVEAAVSDDPARIEEWLVNRFNGSIFEFAVDPMLKKSSEGLSVVPVKPGTTPHDYKEND